MIKKKSDFFPRSIPNSGLVDNNLTFDELYKKDIRQVTRAHCQNSWKVIF